MRSAANTMTPADAMTPADKLLNHFDRIAGSEPRFVRVSEEGASPAMFVAIYRGFPEPEAATGFTVGLSHFHPPGGAHKELTISMRDTDEVWALACGFLAFQLRERCRFECGDTINFREPIARSSSMSAFVVVHPRHVSSRDSVVDLGVRQVELAQLVPLYEQERAWLSAGGNLQVLLKAYPGSALMNPQRDPFNAPENGSRS
jgi:hypothetical protein